jgi:hypothetical protein
MPVLELGTDSWKTNDKMAMVGQGPRKRIDKLLQQKREKNSDNRSNLSVVTVYRYYTSYRPRALKVHKHEIILNFFLT